MTLVVRGLGVKYGAITALTGVDIDVPEGHLVGIVGPNGAGKTTCLRAIGGEIISSGSIRFANEEISDWRAHRVARAGVGRVPQGRRIFSELTVEENLLLGAYRVSKQKRRSLRDDVVSLFPRLAERAQHRAGNLSGGEQQMLAIGRALMMDPQIILMDEPSFGLAPIVIGEVFDALSAIRKRGVSVLLVEQNAAEAIRVCDFMYVLVRGQCVFAGESKVAAEELDFIEAYMT